MEIEKKFLINNIDNLDLTKYSRKEMIQDYLYVDNLTIIRKRKIIQNANNSYKYTIKTHKVGLSVNEFEFDISEEQYNKLKINDKFNCISKVRYIIPYIDNLKIELDIFDGIYKGIIFAEIEFESEEQAMNTKVPDWFSREISNKVTNSDMAIKPVSEIFKILNEKL